MTDFLAYELPFAGFALEPQTEAAQEFLDGFEWEDSTFRAPDACMTGFSDKAVGFEPFLASQIIAELKDNGLTSKAG
jgi:hypothetical protein